VKGINRKTRKCKEIKRKRKTIMCRAGARTGKTRKLEKVKGQEK
jgi:hypothetical protein